MNVIEKAYAIGVAIATDGSAVVPEDVLLSEGVFNLIMSGYADAVTGPPARVRVCGEFEDWSKYQDWFKKSKVVIGLTPEEIGTLTRSDGWDDGTYDPAPREGLIQMLSELCDIPLNGMRSSGPGSWYCSGIAWDTRLFEATGTIEVYYTGGQDV